MNDLIRSELIDHYWTYGWVVVPHVFEPAEVAKIAVIATEIGWQENKLGDLGPVTTDTGRDGSTAPRKVDWAFPKHPEFQAFALDSRLNSVVEAILGTKPYLVRDQVFLKPAGIGSSKPWHQDQPHLNCHPADQVIGAWIALDDATPDNGCLRYVSGSHRGPELHHKPMPGAEHNAIPDPEQAKLVDWNRTVDAPVPAGGVALHHPLTLHGSKPNRSPHPRRAYSTHWATEEVTCPDDHTLQWAYSRRLGQGRHAVSAP